jgi:heme-degrading monooxygenase HmoA
VQPKASEKYWFLRREIGDETEYVLVTLWDSMEAIRGFAGPEPERAVYYPEDTRYFPEQEMMPHVRHYGVLGIRNDNAEA